MQRQDVCFGTSDGITVRGWLYLPVGNAAAPAISMAHGFAAVKEHGLDRFASLFCESGFVVLVHDHRGFGSSDGLPRDHIDPWQQIADWRDAITFLEQHDRVQEDRIGIWGTSYAGGHALVLGATDPRVRCVVSQVPTISGFEQGLRRVTPDATLELERDFVEEDRRLVHGHQPDTVTVAASDGSPAAYRTREAADFYGMPSAAGVWNNAVTVRSNRAARLYEPGIWAPRVSPTPLHFIVATHDTVTLTDLGVDAYESSRPPKGLTLVRGGHFAPYEAEFDAASAAALSWFRQHLRHSPP